MSSVKQTRTGFSVTRVLIALFCIGLVVYLASEGFLIAWRPVVIREATPDDKMGTRYFGFDVEKVDEVRNIAVAEGTFSKSTSLLAALYLVRSGKVDEVNAFTGWRSPNQIGSPIWMNMRIKLALGEVKRAGGRITQLGIIGASRIGGRGNEIVHDIEIVEKKTLPGRLISGKTYILHVEGDRKFEVRRGMSVEEFAMANAGNFLVVVVQVN